MTSAGVVDVVIVGENIADVRRYAQDHLTHETWVACTPHHRPRGCMARDVVITDRAHLHPNYGMTAIDAIVCVNVYDARLDIPAD